MKAAISASFSLSGLLDTMLRPLLKSRQEKRRAKARAGIAKTVVDIVRRQGERLRGKFTVVQPGRVRVGRVP